MSERDFDHDDLGRFDPTLPDLPFDEDGGLNGERREDRRHNTIDDRPTGLERRRGPGRRLTDFVKAAEEGEMTTEQFLFLRAIETFKRVNNRHYPNWTDVLEVVRLLGYRKTASSELSLPGLEDWRELPTAPSNVRTREGVRHSRSNAA